MLIASNVERTWLQTSEHHDIPHLKKALWINTGCRSLKVWLPLAGSTLTHSTSAAAAIGFTSRTSSDKKDTQRTYIARRIMLPVDVQMYALAIDEACLACGVASTALSPCAAASNNASSTTCAESTATNAPVHCLSRESEVFLHRLLKQLLKRNLGSYALEIASACRCLPYFGHILELLLHDVVEDEATSSEPIPGKFNLKIVA